MNSTVKEFFRMFHDRHLKPRGFKKVGHNFYRIADDYTERIQFQGSAWNSAGGPWRFYVNIGVEFRGIRTRTNRGFPRTHCHGRLNDIVKRSPQHFDFALNKAEQLARRLSRLLESATDTISHKQRRCRTSYQKSGGGYVEMR
jgi:hypothetical protein